MQITFSLPKDLVVQLQDLPNPDQFVSEAIRAALQNRSKQAPKKITLPIFRGDGLQPTVDLNDSKQLYDKLDENGFA
ncbi:MAG: hypothetical protein SVR94_09935 [Pseudomonadota bacterium]|nr:hypothetical protein [Pseudomonadota bacterium]